MSKNPSAPDVTIFGIAICRMTLIRITGGGFVLMGLLHLVEAFFRSDAVVWWKLVLGLAMLALGILCLVARPADPEST